MESVGRMTRSRAKALGATPLSALPAKTPEPKTTGRRRKGAAKDHERTPQEAVPKQLHFPGDAAAEEHPADQQPVTTESSKQEMKQPLFGLKTVPALQPDDTDMHAENHDDPSVLMASPIILANTEQPVSTHLEPLPLNLHADGPVVASPLMIRFQPGTALLSESADTGAASGSLDVPQAVAGSPLSIAADSPVYSPLPIAASPLSVDASPLPPVISPLPAAASPPTAAMMVSPMVGVLNQANPEPAAPSPPPGAVAAVPLDSPMATITPLSFTSDAPRNGATASAQPQPTSIPASPLSITAEAIDAAIFSPLLDDGPGGTPLSLSELSPQSTPPLQPQQLHGALDVEGLPELDDDAMMAESTPLAAEPGTGEDSSSPPTFASDRRALTPGTAPSSAPAFASAPPNSTPHASASPAPAVSSFQGFAAVFSTPIGSELEPGSPSLAGLMSAGAPSPSMFIMSADASAAAIATEPTPTIPLNNASASVTASYCDVEPSPTCAPDHVSGPFTSATMATPTLDADRAGGASVEDISAQRTADNTTASPLEITCLPPAPAPTPECGALPGWTLAQTPLVNALAVSLTGQSEDKCEDAAEENEQMEGEEETTQGVEADVGQQQTQHEQLPPGAPVEDMEMDDKPRPPHAEKAVAPTTAVPASVQQPTSHAATVAPVARTPPLHGRSPAIGPAFRAGAVKSTADKLTAKPGTPTIRPGYVMVESRYQKTPTTGATAAKPRPSISGAAAGLISAAPVSTVAKSTKRVSIHTPEGTRSAAPHRQVVPTPFRPKASQVPVPVAPEQDSVEETAAGATAAEGPQSEPELIQQLPLNPQAAEERRVKVTERPKRHKAMDGTDQGAASALGPVARLSSGPGYLAPTQAFAVKSSKGPKGKVEAATSDTRSLRQLKREVKDVMAKKEAKAALTEARSTKLISKVGERLLPMPDDDEASDDQAEYNEGQENDLVVAMSGLAVCPAEKIVALRGLPAPQGRHFRFDEKGRVTESPQRTVLRGLPVASGKYKRFE